MEGSPKGAVRCIRPRERNLRRVLVHRTHARLRLGDGVVGPGTGIDLFAESEWLSTPCSNVMASAVLPREERNASGFINATVYFMYFCAAFLCIFVFLMRDEKIVLFLLWCDMLPNKFFEFFMRKIFGVNSFVIFF